MLTYFIERTDERTDGETDGRMCCLGVAAVAWKLRECCTCRQRQPVHSMWQGLEIPEIIWHLQQAIDGNRQRFQYAHTQFELTNPKSISDICSRLLLMTWHFVQPERAWHSSPYTVCMCVCVWLSGICHISVK